MCGLFAVRVVLVGFERGSTVVYPALPNSAASRLGSSRSACSTTRSPSRSGCTLCSQASPGYKRCSSSATRSTAKGGCPLRRGALDKRRAACPRSAALPAMVATAAHCRIGRPVSTWNRAATIPLSRNSCSRLRAKSRSSVSPSTAFPSTAARAVISRYGALCSTNASDPRIREACPAPS
jgi:hypothetical protein